MTTMKFDFRLSGVALAALMAMQAPEAIAELPRDQLVIAVNMSSMRGLDPQELNQFESAEVVANLYDRLVTLPADDITTVQPMLAESWEVSEDGLTFTFHIRDGVRFHSGNPLTARDVEYNLRRLVKMGLAPARDPTQWGLTAENVDDAILAADDSTLVIELPELWNSDLVLCSLASFSTSVVDSKLVEENSEGDDYGRTFLQTADAGSGPYSLRTWRSNDLLIADANPDYWDGAPSMKRVLMRHIPESSAQRLEIEARDIDIASRLSSSDLNALSEDPEIEIVTTPGVGFYYIALNQEHGILSDPKVREAFRHLIDYEGLANTVMKYYGNLQQTIVPAGMPGAMVGEMPYSLDGDQAGQEAYDRVYRQLGLDRPLYEQFLRHVWDVLHLDFGRSHLSRNEVATDLARVFPATVELATPALLIGTLLGVPLGVMAAVRRGSWVDPVARVGCSTPIFWLGMIVILVFYAKLGWIPAGNRVGLYYEGLVEGPTGFLVLDAVMAGEWEVARSALGHLVAPALVLGWANTAYISRMSRSFMLEQLNQEYILTARAKGASEREVIWRHAFGNMRVQLLTVIALAYCGLLDGTVLIETVFGWPGLGQYLTTALFFADMNAVLGAVLLIGVISIAINLLCDIAYRTLDPRTK